MENKLIMTYFSSFSKLLFASKTSSQFKFNNELHEYIREIRVIRSFKTKIFLVSKTMR